MGSRRYKLRSVLFLVMVNLFLVSTVTLGLDWPQLQNGPGRHGYSSENINTPISNRWVKGFAPEKLFPQTQPIIVSGKLFIGTVMGTFYCLDALTGAELWTYTAGGPIMATAGAENNRVFFSCDDGCVYALDFDGNEIWKFDTGLPRGFSTAVLLAEGNIFVGNRKGIFYCISQADKSIVWQRDMGEPIMMTSAYDSGRVFVPVCDMKLYALDSQTGNIEWSGDCWGATFKDYWPVAYNNYVFVRPMKLEGGVNSMPHPWLPRRTGLFTQQEMDNQANQIAAYQADWTLQNLFVFQQNDGQSVIMPHFMGCLMNGAGCPPCVDGDGKLIISASWETSYGGGWCRLDTGLRRVIETLQDGNGMPAGNPDENLCVSAAGRLVLIFHTQEQNANFTGVWHLDNRQATQIPFYYAETYYWGNSQGGGTTAAAVSNGIMYHTTQNNLNARTCN